MAAVIGLVAGVSSGIGVAFLLYRRGYSAGVAAGRESEAVARGQFPSVVEPRRIARRRGWHLVDRQRSPVRAP